MSVIGSEMDSDHGRAMSPPSPGLSWSQTSSLTAARSVAGEKK